MLHLRRSCLHSCSLFERSRKIMNPCFTNWNCNILKYDCRIGKSISLIMHNFSVINTHSPTDHVDESSFAPTVSMKQEKLHETVDSSNKFSNCWRKLRYMNAIVHCNTNSLASLPRITDVLLACGVNFAYFERNGQNLPDPYEVSSIYYNVELNGEQMLFLDVLSKFQNSGNSKPFLVLDFTIPKAFSHAQDLILDSLEMLRPTVIRCRPNDVLYLTDGVAEDLSTTIDSPLSKSFENVTSNCCKLARILHTIVCMNAPCHTVVSSCGTLLAKVPIDNKQLNRISGINNVPGVLCSATLLAEQANPFLAVTTAIAAYKYTTGEAIRESKGPGSMGISLLDQLYRLCLTPDNLSDDIVTISNISEENSS